MITESAVEAAARAEFDYEFHGTPAEWEMMGDETRNRYLARTRAALEAAAPHMLALELDAAARDLEESAQIIQVRSHDAGMDNAATVHAMKTDADMLRARAATYWIAK